MAQDEKRPDGMYLFYQEWETALNIFTAEEIGELLTALFAYFTTDAVTSFSERSMSLFYNQQIATIDRDRERYKAKCEQNSRNIRKRYAAEKEDSLDTTEYDSIRSLPITTTTPTTTSTATTTSTSTESPSSKESPTHKYGEYKRVKLTDAEYERLLTDLGEEELQRCIRYIDEAAQEKDNKYKWKDWNLVIRKCHREGWGLDRGKAKPGSGKAPDRQVVSTADVQDFLKYVI